MEASHNEATATWHLLGVRGCGADPDGELVAGNWAEIRDHVERSDGTRGANCHWPR